MEDLFSECFIKVSIIIIETFQFFGYVYDKVFFPEVILDMLSSLAYLLLVYRKATDGCMLMYLDALLKVFIQFLRFSGSV